jgi:2'-5' RNA ligase
MLRTFIAVKIAQTAGLRRLHARLSDLGDRFRPVPADNLHVTLKFLGDTAEGQLPQVGAVVKRALEGQAAIFVKLSGLGAFPDARRPTVLWIGLDEAQTLCRIASDLDRELAPLGFAPDRRAFQAHLTLLRIKSRPPDEFFSLLAEESATDFGMVRIDEVEFLQSELTRAGSRYTRLANFPLADSGREDSKMPKPRS